MIYYYSLFSFFFLSYAELNLVISFNDWINAKMLYFVHPSESQSAILKCIVAIMFYN